MSLVVSGDAGEMNPQEEVDYETCADDNKTENRIFAAKIEERFAFELICDAIDAPHERSA